MLLSGPRGGPRVTDARVPLTCPRPEGPPSCGRHAPRPGRGRGGDGGEGRAKLVATCHRFSPSPRRQVAPAGSVPEVVPHLLHPEAWRHPQLPTRCRGRAVSASEVVREPVDVAVQKARIDRLIALHHRLVHLEDAGWVRNSSASPSTPGSRCVSVVPRQPDCPDGPLGKGWRQVREGVPRPGGAAYATRLPQRGPTVLHEASDAEDGQPEGLSVRTRSKRPRCSGAGGSARRGLAATPQAPAGASGLGVGARPSPRPCSSWS